MTGFRPRAPGLRPPFPMLNNFEAYQLAVEFYRLCDQLPLPRHLRDQLLRASSSISLNLAEGTERTTVVDRRRYYKMALGSIRECQAILNLAKETKRSTDARRLADRLGAITFKLCESLNQIITIGNGGRGPEARGPRPEAGTRTKCPKNKKPRSSNLGFFRSKRANSL